MGSVDIGRIQAYQLNIRMRVLKNVAVTLVTLFKDFVLFLSLCSGICTHLLHMALHFMKGCVWSYNSRFK